MNTDYCFYGICRKWFEGVVRSIRYFCFLFLFGKEKVIVVGFVEIFEGNSCCVVIFLLGKR